MSDYQIAHEGSKALDQVEHSIDANAKRVVMRYQDLATGDWFNNPAPFINQDHDYIGFSNADSNGNYQTITYKSGGSSGTTMLTLSLTYDANNKVTSIARS